MDRLESGIFTIYELLGDESDERRYRFSLEWRGGMGWLSQDRVFRHS
jgi:hypothetical protein